MSNMLRMTGMATGMDTEATIKQLMKPYNMKADKLKQEKQNMQWKQEIMRDMIKDLRGLKNDYLNIDSPDATNMIKAGSFSVANITSSNEEILTATAMPGVISVPTSMNVEQTAKPAKLIANLKNVTGETLISSNISNLGFDVGQTVTLTYGKDTFSYKIEKDESIQSFINNLNSTKSTTGTTALYEKAKITYSELTGSLNIESRNTGKDESITLSVTKDTDPTFKKDTTANGQEAIVYIKPQGYVPPVPPTAIETAQGIKVIRQKNDFTIDNVCYSLNPNAVSNGTAVDVTLTSKADAQKSVDKIKGFVDKYNAIVDKIYAKYSEKKQYKYLPLTDEQKKDMKEEEIKKWEAKAKEGIVKSDESLGSMLNAMRTALFSPVAAAGISLQDIGLDSYSRGEASIKPGQIKIVDLTKLKSALETRGDQVMKLFGGAPDKSITDDKTMTDADKAKKIYDNTGVFKRLNDILNNYVGKTDAILLKRVGIEGTLSATKNDMADKLKKQDDIIYKMEKKIADQENRYYQKFAQLEKAMNALNSQSNWLTSQLGGGK